MRLLAVQLRVRLSELRAAIPSALNGTTLSSRFLIGLIVISLSPAGALGQISGSKTSRIPSTTAPLSFSTLSDSYSVRWDDLLASGVQSNVSIHMDGFEVAIHSLSVHSYVGGALEQSWTQVALEGFSAQLEENANAQIDRDSPSFSQAKALLRTLEMQLGQLQQEIIGSHADTPMVSRDLINGFENLLISLTGTFVALMHCKSDKEFEDVLDTLR